MVTKNNEFLKIQKNRSKKTFKKPTSRFGDFGLACKNEGRIELLHITQIKKKLKKFIQKKKSEIDIIREKIWYFGRPNFFIQKKSKNSRMGKGKGLIERRTMRVKKNFIIFEFKGVSTVKIRKLAIYMNKFMNVKVYTIVNYDKTFVLWSKNNKFLLYHEKYLFQ